MATVLTSFAARARTSEGAIPCKVSEEESKNKSVKWKKKVIFIEETSCPSALPYPGAASSSCQREEKGGICYFSQQD